MPITLNGSGTVTGISAGGLPDGCIQSADLATGVGGKILQVKQAVKTDKFTSSASTADITGLSVNITPAASTSKIFIIASVNAMANNVGCAYKLNGTANGDISIAAADGSRTRASSGDVYESNNSPFYTHVTCFLDSPNTTSQQTYKVISISTQSSTIKINRGNTDTDTNTKINGVSSITVIEVAA